VRWFSIFVLILLLAIPLAAAVLAYVCTEPAAAISADAILSSASVERAKTLLHEHDPRKLRSGETKTVRMDEEELNLVLNHLINRIGDGGAALAISEGALSVVATFNLSALLPQRYLNIDLEVGESGGSPHVAHLRFGPVSIPRGAVDALIRFGAEHLYRASGVHNAAELIRGIELEPRHLAVTYEWKAGIVDAVRDRFVSQADRDRLRIYNAALAGEVERQGSSLTFASLLEAMFRLAGERSRDGDPAAENGAAIITVAAYVNGKSLSALAPEAQSWVAPQRRRLKLGGRRDFAQHFSTSAALAVTGGSAVANAIGLFKEIDDADGGSGFSFKDLAADMAGTQFGNRAVDNEDGALAIQAHAVSGLADRQLMPGVDGFRESLSDEVFNAEFGGVGSEKYTAVVREIERRIAALPIYAN
jgi:hypothetical protein